MYKKIKNNFNELCSDIKSDLNSIKDKKQKLVTIIILVVLATAFLALSCWLVYYITPILAAVASLFFLYWLYREAYGTNSLHSYTEIDTNAVWEIMFEILRDNALALDLVPPTETTDILCTEHLTPMLINNCKVLRFIDMESFCDPVKDCQYVKSALNTLLNQRLSIGYPNLPVINGIYPVQVIEVGHSSQHKGFVYIDVLLIDSLEALNLCNQRNGNHPQSPPSTPKDKDFN